MKAIVCEKFGPIDQLRYTEIPDPEPGPNEVVVAVRACGVNFPDALIVQGLYQDRPALPFSPGIEFAGDVIRVGSAQQDSDGLQPGDRVLGFSSRYGAYAEQIACATADILRMPATMSYEVGANIACAHGTAHHALKQRAQLQPGETLLVLGAAGGTGIAAVQIGKAMGAHVIAACSSDAKLDIARANGADSLINYSDQDLRARLKELTGGKGVDVVYDPVGGDLFHVCCRSMARNGRLLVVGFASGTIPELPVNLALVKEFSVIGVFWGSFARHQPQLLAANMAELFQWLAENKVRVVTDARFSLAEAPVALQRLAGRQVMGKAVLIPGNSRQAS